MKILGQKSNRTSMQIQFGKSLRNTSTIHFGHLASHIDTWKHLCAFGKCLIITDSNTDQFCKPILQRAIPDLRFHSVTIPAGEQSKQIDTCVRIWNTMAHLQLGRNDLVILLGGGVVGDLGGFCAATFKRGLPFVMIPTTLLSMADSSIGAKLGVDLQGLKNMVGVFALPTDVFIDPVFLQTLPEHELKSGMAEVLKHAAIGRRQAISEQLFSTKTNEAEWLQLLIDTTAVKARIVKKDPTEKGLRKLLNFGHTVGHAIETALMHTSTPISHGHAIAIGMVIELDIAQIHSNWAIELRKLIRNHYDFSPINNLDPKTLLTFMQNDKKKTGNEIMLSLPAQRSFSLLEVPIQELKW
jgi:3-dehydroquinate synthase